MVSTSVPVRTGAHALFDVLQQWGIDLLFTCPGSTEAAVLDASIEIPAMRMVLTTHESIAVSAADGYARVSGRPAIAYLHANVGLANGVAHLACASSTHTPLLVLNGMKSSEMQNRGGFTTARYPADPVREYVREARVLLSTDALAEDLTRTITATLTEPGGPAFLGLPQDLVEAPFSGNVPAMERHRISSRRRPDPAAVEAAAQLLRSARTVTIVAGAEIANDDARGALTALATRLGAPVLIEDRRTMTASGILGDDPAFAGVYAPNHPAVIASDVLLFAGMPSFTEFEPLRAPVVPAGAKVVHLCSDPAEVAKREGVDVGLVGNAALALDDLTRALGSGTATTTAHRERAVAAERARTAEHRAALRARYDEAPMHPIVACNALDESLPRDAFIIGDAVTSNGYLADAVISGSHREFLSTGGGSLGWGMGAAIGVKLAKPEATVVAAVGDGAFQFGVQALWTAAVLRLAIIFIVIDNESYAAVKAGIKRYRRRGGRPDGDVFPTSDLPGTDIAAISRGFGAFAETVDTIAGIAPAIERARAFDGPAVIVIKTDVTHTGP
jgi:thiamine pyrophosphate-dependent acetolactate synthase large subunit-like protein